MITFDYVAPLLAFLGSTLALGIMLRYASLLPLDLPNSRSLHVHPTPRVGGMGMVVGILGACLFSWGTLSVEIYAIVGLALSLSIFSIFDDWRGLSVRVRFAAHILAGVAALWVLAPTGAVALWVVLLFCIIWVTNLFNFMDGADGLAGGMAVIGFGVYAAAAVANGDGSLGVLAAMLAAASMGFLVFNFPPAKIFMGDAGSIPLGFLAASLGMYGWTTGVWPWTFPLLVFSPFLVDASLTLMRRGLRGERVWLAHREHYYQRLVRMGWSRRRLITAEYFLMTAASGSAMALLSWPLSQWPLLAAWGTLYFVLARWIDHKWESINDV